MTKQNNFCVFSKWQALVVTGQDNDEMDVIVQRRGIFYIFGCSGKNYDEAFNFRVQITKDMKNFKEFKETIRYLFLLRFSLPFSFSLTTANCNPE